MTQIPLYLKSYPNMQSSFPFHISKNTIERGYPAHRHDFLELSYVIAGNGWEVINGVRHKMVTGTFTFVLPYQVHELISDPSDKLVLYNCMFAIQLLAETGLGGGLRGLLTDLDQLTAHTEFKQEDQKMMRRLMDELYTEYVEDSPWRQTLLQAKLKEVIIRFDRYRRRERSDNPDNTPLAIDHTTTDKAGSNWPIIYHIHRNYQEDITLTSLAGRFNLSQSRLSELIKQTTGQTFVHFLHDLRTRHACSLLVSTEMSVTEIAMEVGYGSYKTFARIFRDTQGMSPSDYRRMKSSS
ncbi:helix-turn-helix domain-containing protein [Paenibacillus sp. GCM10023252]|uniref:helix-turn-helix domain-containing protein n=1 Tax=Paenibacillus sp. GCM10023252 TaxID=3252649 RepID=UPI00361CA483